MDEPFYQRLFAGSVIWALHTTYTCDLGFVTTLLEQQRRADPDDADQTGRTAVFYHSSPRIVPTVRSLSKKWPLQTVKSLLHPLKQGTQTFHAKISLVRCHGETGPLYRLAVLSRNLDNSPCRDLAMLFCLEVGEEETESGRQLISYLEKLRVSTDDAGKKWLSAHLGQEEKDRLRRVTLRSEFGGKKADLFFGGLAGTCSLGERLQLDTAQSDSLVLTPPEFLRGGRPWDKFQEWHKGPSGPQLYDLRAPGSGSHCKLYLLHHAGDQYALWAGSANATPRGLGWPGWEKSVFSDAPGDASVECLVRFSLTEEEFTRLHEEIEETDAPFSFTDNARGSLIVHPDLFGPWVCANYKVTGLAYTGLAYQDKKGSACAPRQAANLVVTLTSVSGTPAPCPQVPSEGRIWRPAEYAETVPFPDGNGRTVTLTYPLQPRQKFSPTQGVLLFGASCAALWVPQYLLKEVPQAKAALQKDTRLTEWLISASALNSVEPETDFRSNDADKLARRYYDILCGSPLPSCGAAQPLSDPCADKAALPSEPLPPAAKAEEILQEHPLPFQKNAAARLVHILQKSSRAFLADEAGLGKTYSAAAAICTLAKARWDAQGENEGPLICLYVASNRALLTKCTHDFQSKAQGLLGNSGQVVVLNDRLSRKDALYLALLQWFLRKKSHLKDPDSLGILIEAAHRATDQLQAETEQTLYKQGVCRFVKGLRDACYPGRDSRQKYLPKDFKKLAADYRAVRAQPDRLIHHERLLDRLHLTGRTLVILPVTAGCLLVEERSDGETKRLKEAGYKTREEFTTAFLEKRKPLAVIWDEYHLYTPKLHKDNSLYCCLENWETKSHLKKGETESQKENRETERKTAPIPMKSLFLSATPYRTNISGQENQAVLDELYRTLQSNEKEELTRLPSFEKDFAPLFCAGAPPLRQNVLRAYYHAFQKSPGDPTVRAQLQKSLRMRMVRHERTQLQEAPELPRRLYPPRGLDPDACAPVLCNTMAQCRALEEAGFTEGDRSWSLSMPWILSFFKKDEHTDHQRLNPSAKRLQDDPALFVYDKEGEPIPERLETLPRQSLPFYEICRETLQGRMGQLLWIPPTVPLYQPPGGSIFRQYRDYSKMLVFAEYRYYQRGGALLLSDYAKLGNTRSGKPLPGTPFSVHCAQTVRNHSFALNKGDYRNMTLDELIQFAKDTCHVDATTALALIASPAACARALEFRDPAAVESSFNEYWNRDGVKQALWAWLCDNGYDAPDRWEEGILRYCAEGNLYAVLEEWQFMTRDHQDEALSSLLGKEAAFARVTVQSSESLTNQGAVPHRRPCSFADRLTGDVGDVNSGDNEEVISACARRFSSPFWPMVLFAGRGAQEGMDFHQYCLSIMHLTLPRGAVSFDQRNGRIDRFHSLLVRRRAAEQLDGLDCDGNTQALLSRLFAWLKTQRPGADPEDQLYPHWHIPDQNSRHHLLQLFPVWPFTREEIALQTCDAMLESYRRPFGTSAGATTTFIDLRAP